MTNPGHEGLRLFRVPGIQQGVGEPDEALRERVARRVGLAPEALHSLRLVRRSLDARRARAGLHFVCQLEFGWKGRQLPQGLRRALRSGHASEAAPPPDPQSARRLRERDTASAAIVGAGPAGLFAAWILARNGVRVRIVERGQPVPERARSVVRFHRTRALDPDSNLLYGEGGAGTFSDGKLYTRIDDAFEPLVLEELVACGAPADILYDSRAHIGTDRLHRLLPRLRERLEAAGVEFCFGTRMQGLVIEEGPLRRVRALTTNRGELACDALFLAPGHSARDTWGGLHAQGVLLEAKPFQLGVRVEHPQELVTRARYGAGREAALLGAASYNLVARPSAEAPGAHSFCMCPGGKIVASISEAGYLCTNGMSNSRHSSPYANAALVTTVGPEDWGAGAERDPFIGVALQRELEARFFEGGGATYAAPAQRASDFLAGRPSGEARLRTSYTFGALPARVDRLLPPRIARALAHALLAFERSIPGFAGPEGILVGIETRSSGPVRVLREPESRRATGFANLLPVGEGAGYAGGITSAALDGLRAALAWLEGGP